MLGFAPISSVPISATPAVSAPVTTTNSNMYRKTRRKVSGIGTRRRYA